MTELHKELSQVLHDRDFELVDTHCQNLAELVDIVGPASDDADDIYATPTVVLARSAASQVNLRYAVGRASDDGPNGAHALSN